MKFRVCFVSLLHCADGLEDMARRQKQMLADLQDNMHQLRRLSCMDGILRQLGRQERAMKEQLQKTLRMAQALRRVHRVYQAMELAVLDGTDRPHRSSPQPLSRTKQGIMADESAPPSGPEEASAAEAELPQPVAVRLEIESSWFRAAPVMVTAPAAMPMQNITIRLSGPEPAGSDGGISDG